MATISYRRASKLHGSDESKIFHTMSSCLMLDLWLDKNRCNKNNNQRAKNKNIENKMKKMENGNGMNKTSSAAILLQMKTWPNYRLQTCAHTNTVMRMLFSFVLTNSSFRRLYNLEFIIIFQWLPHTLHFDSKLCRLPFGTRNARAFINMKSSVSSTESG